MPILPQNWIRQRRIDGQLGGEEDVTRRQRFRHAYRLYLQIGGHQEENNAAERQSVDNRRQKVGLFVRQQIFAKQGPHAFLLPEEKPVDKRDFEHTLQVGRENSQAEHHAD